MNCRVCPEPTYRWGSVFQRPACYNSMTMNDLMTPDLVREVVGDVAYEYYPLGEFVVVAPGVCGGRPTFKYTRLEVNTILALLGEGRRIDEVVSEYEASGLDAAAIREALQLAGEALAFSNRALALYPLAV